MQRDKNILSSKNFLSPMSDSFSNPYTQMHVTNVNVSGITQKNDNSIKSERLDDIIAKTFENLDNEEFEDKNQQSQEQNVERRLGYASINQNNVNRSQLGNDYLFKIEKQTQSIVNSSNKDSFQRITQRVPGKLTHSQEPIQQNQFKTSQDQDYYYNFTIKNSTLDSQYLFNPPHSTKSIHYQLTNPSKLSQHQQQYNNHLLYDQTAHHQPQYQNSYQLRQSSKFSTSNRTGFIRQNKLNNRTRSKPNQLPGPPNNLNTAQDSNIISQHEEFEVHFNRQPRENSKSHQSHHQYTNNLDEEHSRRVNENKSTTQSLKQTFDSQKTNYYQLNSFLNHNQPIRKKNRSHYSQVGHDNHLNSSVCLSQLNPYIKEYETDLFDFIKKQLINTTVQKKQLTQKEVQILAEHNAQKKKNVSLSHLYKMTKLQLKKYINDQRGQIESLKVEIKFLEEQILFCRQHSLNIEQSIKTKIKRQDEFYFKHKANLQSMILSNNQLIADLKNQLSKVKQLENNLIETESKQKKIRSLENSKNENKRLREELIEQQLQYQNSVKKITQNHNIVHSLQQKKADEIKGLVEQFQNAKKLIHSLK